MKCYLNLAATLVLMSSFAHALVTYQVNDDKTDSGTQIDFSTRTSLKINSAGTYQLKTTDGLSRHKSNLNVPLRSIPTQKSLAPQLGAGSLKLIVFKTHLLSEYEEILKQDGVEDFRFIPHQAVIAKVSPAALKKIKVHPFIERIEDYSNLRKLAAPLYNVEFSTKSSLPKTYNLIELNKSKRAANVKELKKLGATLVQADQDELLIKANLTDAQVMAVAESPNFTWIEPNTKRELDMYKVHIQTGLGDINNAGQRVDSEIASVFKGHGIRGHIFEGIYPKHPDLAANKYRKAPIAIVDPTGTSHGQSTFGIIFGSGEGNKDALGVMPWGQGYYTSYHNERNSRYSIVKKLLLDHKIFFQTASWGNARTTEYTAVSANMDNLIFELDIPITQSQSNAGNRDSRPQAWAKNIISVGGVRNSNTPDPTDDYWKKSASIGPAPDGRIKPDLVAYYDNTLTIGIDRGYAGFGGTSGATPIVAGLMGISLEMFTKGVFSTVKLPFKPTIANMFKNRPHAATTKALMIANATQYKFSGLEHDHARVHQGWGFPDIKTIYGMKDKMLVDDEGTRLRDGQKKKYVVEVARGEDQFKVSMVYREPAAPLSAQKQLLNDLNLKVTSPSGVVYYGNWGLRKNMWSNMRSEDVLIRRLFRRNRTRTLNRRVSLTDPNMTFDKTNNVENVFIQNPEPGKWTIEVIAHKINVDTVVETKRKDAHYGLVAVGGVPVN